MQYSQELENIFNYIKEDLMEEFPSVVINVNYFILAVLNPRVHSYTYDILESMLPDAAREEIFKTFRQIVSSSALSAVKPNRPINLGADMNRVIAIAEEEAHSLNHDTLNSFHIFMAILKDERPGEENKIIKLFNKVGVNYVTFSAKLNSWHGDDENAPENESPSTSIMEEAMKAMMKNNEENGKKGNKIKIINFGANGMDGFDPMSMFGLGNNNKKKGSTLTSYCTNLNEEYKKGNIDCLVARDKEIDTICATLSRRKKNSVVIVGQEGVGKTALCEGLAGRISEGNVPASLMDKVIYSLNITSLIAGTQLRGMVEDRVQNLISDIASTPNAILFIDDIHALFTDKANTDIGIPTMFSKALNDGKIQIIGTTSYKGFHTVFDNNPGLSRRFQKVIVNPVTAKETKDILLKIKQYYEDYHNVTYTEEALDACITLGEKYITERQLPDSAIDIMDDAGAEAKINHPKQVILHDLYQRERDIETEQEKCKSEDNFARVDELEQEKKRVHSDVLALTKEIMNDNPVQVIPANIYKVVTKKTSIPLEEVSVSEKQKLINMENNLKKYIVGQDEAIEKVCRALKRNRLGLRTGKCILSLMANGGTGVGKTLMAKRLAVELFGDENALVRFDMSEYADKTAVNKLIGSNAGYVGYENGGLITEAIKNKKYCVLLLDEFEKADPEIYNLFLQVFDEGYLTDNTGQKVDFKNTIIIITSNIGAKRAQSLGIAMDFEENNDKARKSVLDKELKNKFSPEFLNRIDEIIYFNSLTTENLRGIIKLEIEKFNKQLNTLGHTLTYDEATVDFILSKVSSEKEFGARPVQRAIQHEIEDKIADLLLENEYKNHMFNITCFSENINID